MHQSKHGRLKMFWASGGYIRLFTICVLLVTCSAIRGGRACSMLKVGWTPLSVENRTAKAQVVIAATVLRSPAETFHSQGGGGGGGGGQFSAEVLVNVVYKGYASFNRVVARNDRTVKPNSAPGTGVYVIRGFGARDQCLAEVQPGRKYIMFLTVFPVTNGRESDGMRLSARYDDIFGAAVDFDHEQEGKVLKTLGWREWASWSPCPVTCGGGIQIRRRMCVEDVPDACEGAALQERHCNQFECEDAKNLLELMSLSSYPYGVRRTPRKWKSYRISPDAILKVPIATAFPGGFPDEFSILLKVRPSPDFPSQRNGYLYAMLITGSNGEVQLGVQLGASPALVYSRRDAITGKLLLDTVTFHEYAVVGSRRWHTLAFGVRRNSVTMYADCTSEYTVDLEEGTGIRVAGPGDISIGNSKPNMIDIFFEGDMEQLTLIKDPDAAALQCSSPMGSFPSEASWPAINITHYSAGSMDVLFDIQIPGDAPTHPPTTVQVPATAAEVTSTPTSDSEPAPVPDMTSRKPGSALVADDSTNAPARRTSGNEVASTGPIVAKIPWNNVVLSPVVDEADIPQDSKNDIAYQPDLYVNGNVVPLRLPITRTESPTPSHTVPALPTTHPTTAATADLMTTPTTRLTTVPTTAPTTVPTTTRSTTTVPPTNPMTVPPAKPTTVPPAKPTTPPPAPRADSAHVPDSVKTLHVPPIPNSLNDRSIASDLDSWSTWSTCSRSCGTGTRYRFSRCRPGSGLKDCKTGRGIAAQNQLCHLADCRVPTLHWSTWTTCSRTCGDGIEMRMAYCYGNKLPGCENGENIVVERRLCRMGHCFDICRPSCKNGGFCRPDRKCLCSSGFVGPSCEIELCSSPCLNGGQCIAEDFCLCPAGYTAPQCAPLCDPSCQNGGTCRAPYECACTAAFTGKYCERGACTRPCQNGGVCTGPDRCMCARGYGGNQCEYAVCTPSCENGGQCLRPGFCRCPTGYRGSACETAYCRVTCRNGGRCSGPDSCTCTTGFTGAFCQRPLQQTTRSSQQILLHPSSYALSKAAASRRNTCELRTMLISYHRSYVKPVAKTTQARCGYWTTQLCPQTRMGYETAYRSFYRIAYKRQCASAGPDQ